ncbi:hypothetical protein KC717_04905 [Candidatus Dojkabacteria bacterium]|uniref:Uncharacterized protein n=1 Tax=Candidatus Dojkabacteria bacterium TaxID=2099670 RepID=A0A955L973_9BACT|nr:hypothetical protein [Candidatus Dojkabacteria bacterium]
MNKKIIQIAGILLLISVLGIVFVVSRRDSDTNKVGDEQVVETESGAEIPQNEDQVVIEDQGEQQEDIKSESLKFYGDDVAYISKPAQVESFEIFLMESFPIQVTILVRGQLESSCHSADKYEVEKIGNEFIVSLDDRIIEGRECNDDPISFQRSIPLDVVDLPAGEYIVNVEGLTDTFTFDVDNTISQ